MPKTSLVIALDGREAAGQPAGKGRYVQQLLAHLPAAMPDAKFLVFTSADKPTVALASNATYKKIPGAGLTWHRSAASAAKDASVYLSTTSYLTPQLLSVPFVMTVFDLITFKAFANPQRRAKAIERLTLRRAASRANAILTISKSTAHDLASLFPVAGGKITVTPLGADPRFAVRLSESARAKTLHKFALPERFVLSTGTLEPRKNFQRLIEAHAALPAAVRESHPLVIAGKSGWDDDDILAAIQQHGVRHLDFVSDTELAALYQQATVFAYPSLYEGFGLPVLEAMASGTAVLTSRVSSLPEVGGEAVRYADPNDTGALTAALTQLLTDPGARQALAKAGQTRAKEFSWERTAALTADVLRTVAMADGDQPVS